MLSIKKILFTPLLLVPLFSSGQTLVVCTTVSEQGDAVAASSNLTIKSGSAVRFLYRDAAAIETAKLLFFVDKKNEAGTFVAFDTKSSKPEKSQSWSSLEYVFSKSGDYKISVSDARGKTLAETTCSVKIQQGSSSATTDDYYSGARVRFCDKLNASGKADLYSSVLTVTSGATIHICIDHIQTLNTSTVSLEIMTGDGFHEKVETKKVTVKSSEMFAAIPYVFPKAGQYKITAYTGDDKFINSGTVTVRFQ